MSGGISGIINIIIQYVDGSTYFLLIFISIKLVKKLLSQVVILVNSMYRDWKEYVLLFGFGNDSKCYLCQLVDKVSLPNSQLMP